MNSKIIDHLTNPTKAKIFFEITLNEQLTAKKLLEKFSDIAQPTMYRHLKAMLNDGIIKVTGQKQIRGAVEKSYSVNNDLVMDIQRIIEENDGNGYLQLFVQYMMGLMGEFKAYSESENIDILNDGSAFTTAPIYATSEEILEAMTKISEIIQPLMANQQTPERRLHNLCTILTPPKLF